jgi:ribosome-associated protein
VDLVALRLSIHNAARASYSRSGGPGGQNVNKVNTKVILRLRLEDLAGLSEAEMIRLRKVLAPRLSRGEKTEPSAEQAEGGELILSSSEERSRRVNLERAYARMETRIAAAARLPKKRRPTRPSKAERERRLRLKHFRGQKKQDRRFTPEE